MGRNMFTLLSLPDFASGLEIAAHTELPSITPVEGPERLALSFAQQRLWFISQLGRASKAYHIPIGLRLVGDLDCTALRKALDRIVARHETLRTTFGQIDGQPVQRIATEEESRFHLLEHDLRHKADAEGEICHLIGQEALATFDLEQGPLIRGRLIRQEEDVYTLLITMHHIVSDGWSIGVLMGELGVLYDAYRNGEADPLPSLRVQYADYAVWQRGWMGGDILKRQADYWRETLEGAPALLELAPDQERPAEQDYAGSLIKVELEPELTEGLKALSQRHGTTLFMTLLAGWGALLGRLAGQEEVVIGTPVANRGRTEIEGLIGFFVNTLALRLDVLGTRSVGEVLERVKAQVVAAQQHQDIPFEQVVEMVGPVRSLAHSPLFQAMFAWQSASKDVFKLPGLEVAPLGTSPHVTTRFDLTLVLQEAEETVIGGLEYATSLYESSTVERYLGYWRALLRGMVADETEMIGQLPLLSECERRQVVEEWNRTEAEYPSEECIHELFERQAERTPQAVAVVCEGNHLSYGELNARANRLAHHLRERGLGPGDRAVILLERSIELVVAELAILKCGAAYVPIDPSFPRERIRFIVGDSGARIVLTMESMELVEMPATERVNLDEERQIDGVAENLDQPLDSGAMAYIMYTSGSTGQPKGVVIPHRAVARVVINNGYAQFNAEDAVAFAANPAFDATTLEVWAPLLNGGRIVVIEQAVLVDPELLEETLEREGVTALFITTAVFNQCAAIKPGIFAGLRFLLTGGERSDPAAFEQVLKDGEPKHLIHCYGPTETTTFATTYEISEVREDERSIPIGRSIANTRIYILDACGEPAPIGVMGELYIGGAGVALGYLNRPELTAERFVADPFAGESGARMYRTGDLGRWLPDGTIEFVGRNDYQVKVRGFRIELGEIEAQLERHPGIGEAVVVAREESPSDQRLVAYYTGVETGGKSEGAVGAEVLRTYLAANLPDYMVPAAYVRLESLPLTPNGKLDRRALPAPEAGAYATRSYEQPVGEVERALADIWSEVLKVERIGRHDNFFELGGHSLLAVTLIEHMRRRGLQADVRALFNGPTPAGLAALLNCEAGLMEVPPNGIPLDCEELRPEMLPLVKLSMAEIERIVGLVSGGAANVQDIYPLTPLQEGILFHHLMASEGDTYLLSSLYSFESRERLERYVSALQAVVDRHDILRTAVVWEGLSEPVQVVWRKAALPVEEVMVDPAKGDAAEQLYTRFDPRHYRIDVRQAPLMRGYMAYDSILGRWLLLLSYHHIACDGVTLQFIFDEIEAHMLGEAGHLPRPQPFRNFVARARMGVSREEHEVFFRQLLGDVEEPTAPFGLLNVQGDGGGIGESRLQLEEGLSQRVRERARKLGVSAASVFHVAWAQVLGRASGREDVVFGTVLFGRMQGGEGADRVMGLLINTLPVRISVGKEGAEESVLSTHTLLANLLRHEHASLALVQRCSGVTAPAPLFSALLNYRHSAGMVQGRSVERKRVWEGIELLYSQERTNYPLTLSVDDLGEEFVLTAQVEASIDPGRVCGFMQRAVEGLVEALERDPGKAIRSIDVLPEWERRQVVEEWNRTEAEYPSEECIHELFERQAGRTPQAVAVVCEGNHLSYGELNARANRLAHYLREKGVGPDTRVAICLERGPEMVVGMLAILKAGGAYVPLDPAYPPARLGYLLKDSTPIALLTESSLQGFFNRLSEGLPIIDLTAEYPQWADWPECNPERHGVALGPKHLAYVIYTSGSTGMPKGVMVDHANIARLFFATAAWFQFDAKDVWTLFHSFAFDFSVWEIWGALLHGGRLIVISNSTTRSPNEFYRILCREQVTILNQTPSAFRQLITVQAASKDRHNLRKVIFGGEMLEFSTLKPWFQLNDIQCPQLINMYGITETTVHVTYRTINLADTERHEGSLIGRSIQDSSGLHFGCQWRAGADRSDGRAVHRRSGSSAGLSEPAGVDGGEIRG